MSAAAIPLPHEVWREVPEFAYSASNLGRVRSHGTPGHPGRVLKPWQTGNRRSSYPCVALTAAHRFKVAEVVLLAFVGPRPAGFFACHNDGNPQNSELTNLRWDTRAANIEDSRRHGVLVCGERHPWSKLTAHEVGRIRADGRSQRQIAAEYGVAQTLVSQIKRNVIWRHV